MTRSPHRVALADDSVEIRRMLRLVMELDDAFVVVGEAGTGVEAVELVATERPDAIVLDLAMPEMDGLEAIGHIRGVRPATRVVVLSGFDGATMAEEALRRGATAYLTKGTKPRELVSKLKEICHAHRQRRPRPTALRPAPPSRTSTHCSPS